MLGSASISISVDGKWRGQAAMDAAANALEKIGNSAGSSAASVAASIKSQEANYNRLSRIAASTSKSTSADIAAVGESMVVTGGKLYNMGDSLKSVGSLLTTAVTAPLTSLASGSAEAAIAYDTALADVRKVTDMTAQELDALSKSAIEFSKTQPVDANTILEVEALGAQFGIADDKLESFSKTVTGLDIATNMNAEQAATQLAQFKNIVGMSDAEMQNYGSTLVWLGNNFATTESDISNTAARFASAGKQANLSSAEILGFSAAMSSLGIRAEMGGSALSQVFAQISKAVSSGGESLEAFASASNMTASEFSEAWRTNAASAFTALLQGIHDSSEAGKDMNDTLSELGITQMRSSDTMRRLAGSVDLVRSAVDGSNSAWSENTALQNEVDQRNESMASKIQVLKNNVEALAIEVGVPLVNAFLDVVDIAKPVIATVSDIVQAFADADEGTQRMIISIGALAAAAGPATSKLGSLVQGLGGVVTAFGNFTRDAAVYSDAMNTVDGAQMRVYSSAETVATKFGLARNAAVQAAGSVENYISVWEENYRATKMVSDALGKYEAATAKLDTVQNALESSVGKAKDKLLKQKDALEEAQSAAMNLVTEMTGVKEETNETLKAWKSGAATTKSVTKETMDLGSAMSGVGATVATAAKSFAGYATAVAASLAPVVAVTAAVSLVGAIIAEAAQEAQEAAEEQERLNVQETTFADVAHAAAQGAESQAEGIESLGEQVRETTDWLTDFNSGMADTLNGIADNAATLDEYIATIDQLAGKSGLTAYEQQQLAAAVEGYNSITGNSVEVIDAVNGKLSVSTDELKKNADAWKANAEAQAYQELLAESTKKRVEAEREATSASKAAAKSEAEYTERKKEAERAATEYNRAYATGSADVDEYGRKLVEANEATVAAKKAYDENSEALKEAQRDVKNLTATENELSYSMAALSEAVRPVKEALDGFGDGFEQELYNAGVQLDELAVKLQEAGVSTDTLKQVGSENIAALATAFDGDVSKMVWAIQNYNAVPIVDKEGNVNINGASLISTVNGEVYTWNGTALVDKSGNVAVDGTELKAANGEVYVWNRDKLVSKEAYAKVTENAVDGKAEEQAKKTKKAVESIKDTKKTASVDGNVINGSAEKKSDSLRSSLSKTMVDRTATQTMNYVSNYTTNHTTNYKTTGSPSRKAAGGYFLNALGGYIATAATWMDPANIVGEAGAEAVLANAHGDRMVVPLTNRRYSRPFARTLAEEMASMQAVHPARQQRQVVNNTNVNVTIDGRRLSASNPRAMELVSLLVDEFGSVSATGVL